MQICGSPLSLMCIDYIFLKGALCILFCSFSLHTNCFSVLYFFSVILSRPLFSLSSSSWPFLSFPTSIPLFPSHFSFAHPFYFIFNFSLSFHFFSFTFPSHPHSLSPSHVPSLHDVFCPPFVPPPAPRVLYLGRRAGVGLLLRDLGGKWLGSQPASTGGEPLQCASEDSQVDLDQHGPLWLCPTLFCLFLPLFHLFFVFSFFSWLSLGLLKPYCHWKPGWYKNYCMLFCRCFMYMHCSYIVKI